jgi:hypothetical protein
MFKRLFPAMICCLAVSATLAMAAPEGNRSVPLSVGNKWEYAISSMGVMSIEDSEGSKSFPTKGKGHSTEEVTGVRERRANGDVVYEYQENTTLEPGDGSGTKHTVMESLLMDSRDGIFMLSSKVTGLGQVTSGKWVDYDPPLRMYGSGMVPGNKWYMGTIHEDDVTLPMTVTVDGKETVTVPAGSFKDCLKLYVSCDRVTGSMGEGEEKAEIEEGRSVSIVWLYPQVGVVKQVDIMQARMVFEPDQNGQVTTMIGTQRKTKELLPGYKVE